MREVYIIHHNNASTSVSNYSDAIEVAVSIVQAHRNDKAIIYHTWDISDIIPDDAETSWDRTPSIWDCVDSSNVTDFARIAENHRITESL